ncbi:MAG: CTAG/PCC1 family protein [Thermoplasmata archaeon]|nr:CTAG/PCC1 family protein [Thermoplasmata archaeon]
MNRSRWSATFTVQLDSAEAAQHLFRSLGPEAAREVPKTSATISLPTPTSLCLEVRASDAGSLRAAANTFLGWVDLAGASEAVARAAELPRGPKPLSR